jgi:hypothetical protein
MNVIEHCFLFFAIVHAQMQSLIIRRYQGGRRIARVPDQEIGTMADVLMLALVVVIQIDLT